MEFFKRFIYLNLDPVLLARHFQNRAEKIFKVIVVDGQLKKLKHHATRADFQVRRSPHTHSFALIIDAPVLSKVNFDEYIMFIDS